MQIPELTSAGGGYSEIHVSTPISGPGGHWAGVICRKNELFWPGCVRLEAAGDVPINAAALTSGEPVLNSSPYFDINQAAEAAEKMAEVAAGA